MDQRPIGNTNTDGYLLRGGDGGEGYATRLDSDCSCADASGWSRLCPSRRYRLFVRRALVWA